MVNGKRFLIMHFCGDVEVDDLFFQNNTSFDIRSFAISGALLIILDNALLVQSHFILLEPILLCAIALSFISLLKFLKSSKPFSSPFSLFWLVSLGVFLGAAISVKYSAVYTWLMCAIAVAVDFWRRQLPDVTISWRVLAFRATLCVGAVLLLPTVIYGGIFGTHVVWLRRAGLHDHVMTSAFQVWCHRDVCPCRLSADAVGLLLISKLLDFSPYPFPILFSSGFLGRRIGVDRQRTAAVCQDRVTNHSPQHVRSTPLLASFSRTRVSFAVSG